MEQETSANGRLASESDLILSGANDHQSLQAQEQIREEAVSATELMQYLMRVAKSFRMYLPNNPQLQTFVDALNSKLTQHLSRYEELRLDVNHAELTVKGKTVYTNNDPKDSLAFRFYSNGMSALIFSDGIEPRELHEFIEIISSTPSGDDDDDIVTLLWTRDLPHIRYLLVEDQTPTEPGMIGAELNISQKETISRIYSDLAIIRQGDNLDATQLAKVSPAISPAQEDVPAGIFLFSTDEVRQLKHVREQDASRNPLQDAITILSAILYTEQSGTLFAEFAEISVKLVARLIHIGDIDQAIRLGKFLRKLSESDSFPAHHREIMITARKHSVSKEIIADLANLIDKTSQVTPEILSEIILIFGKTSVEAWCELLAIVQNMKLRKVILQTLSEIGKESPQDFIPFLRDSRWYLVRNVVLILRTIEDRTTLESVISLISHDDKRVRREVLLYLAALSEPRAKIAMTRFLQDESSQLRIHALQVISGAKFKGAMKQIKQMAEARDFEERELEEKRTIYETLGELGGDEILPLFRELLMKKSWFNRAKDKEAMVCALAGVKKVRTPAAVKVLEDAAASRNDEVKKVILQAIKDILPV
jgi:HEAT repeat protein